MGTPNSGSFTPARIVALVLIACVVSGLVFLRFASGDDSVAVPAGAKAGDLTLDDCEYATEEGAYEADCGTLVVPENRHDPASRLIALPVKRIRARTAHPGAPLFRLQGGPGGTNTLFPEASRFADDRDVVLVGYRGVDGSVTLDCPEVAASRERSRDWLSTASFEAEAAAFRACADRLRDEGVDLAGYTIPQRVDDLDLARRKLGYGPIDLVSESFGTRLAMIWAWRYPASIRRSVMIGVNPPGHFLWDEATTREQIRRYATHCAGDHSCRSRTDDLAASLDSAFARIPSRWGFLPIKQGHVRTAALFGLFNATSDGGGPFAAPLMLDLLLSVDEGDASGAWLLAILGQLMFPRMQISGDAAAMGLSDAAYAKRFFSSPAGKSAAIGTATTAFMWTGGRLLDAWPVSPDHKLYNHVRDSNVETLLVGGELDFSTPPQVATRELLPHLPNGQQVVFPKLGHSEDFWAYQPTASTRLVETFLARGWVDTSLYTENTLDFTPSPTYGAMAKAMVGVMVGLAAVTVLSLSWMALRVRRAGRLGTKSGVVARSLYAIVLGLGGWLLGVLVVLTTMPGVPLTDGRLAILSMGVPVALGLYLAWVNRDWTGPTKAAGLVVALTGALVGAWLGFNAADVPLALLTAIVGTTVGGNLTLLSLDIAWDRRARDRFPAASGKGAVEAQPSTG